MKKQYRKTHDGEEWLVDGLRHRTGEPAVIWDVGITAWYQNGKQHRADGPAIEFTSGRKHWVRHGLAHRIDGPAIIFEDGRPVWIVEGESVDVVEIFGYAPSVPLSEEEQMLLRLSI